MTSLVVLLREPVTIDATVLAKTAGRAWDADLGDGTGGDGAGDEGDDGFVVSVGGISTIMYQDQPYLVNCFPTPYVEDPETVADSIPDLRLQRLFREHKAWISCNALGIDESTSADEIARYYHRLGKLIANFVDDNALLIYVPETGGAYPITDETRLALEADDPLTALKAATLPPVVTVPPDDAEMAAAIQEAKDTWLRFVAAFEQRTGEEFSIKAPINFEDNTEFIWITVTSLEGDRIYGELANEPADLGPLQLGSKVNVSTSDLADWCYIDPNGEMQGGFTVNAVMKAAEGN